MTTRATLLRSGAAIALSLLPSAAFSAEVPKPCGPDPRERCIAYQPRQIINLFLVPGAIMTIELPDNEAVYSVGASDNGIMQGELPADRVAAGGDTTSDPNIEITVPGGAGTPAQFLQVKAKRDLVAQPFVVIGTWKNPVTGATQLRRHTFEIRTVSGQPGEPESFYSVLFSDPVSEKVVRQANWKAKQEKLQAQQVADRLTQVQASTLSRNVAYDGQGTDADRIALAPSAPAGLDAMWDDGQRTFLRYPGNRGAPMAYQVLPNGTEAVVGQNSVVDPATNGTLLIIHDVLPMIRLRDGEAVLCITNTKYNPITRNQGTGTVDPGIVRDAKGAP